MIMVRLVDHAVNGLAICAALLLLAAPLAAQEHRHPAAGQHDPYAGSHLRNDGKRVNCCSSRDCRPVESRFNSEFGRTEILIGSEWRQLDFDKVVGPPPIGADQQKIHACWQERSTGPGPVLCVFVGGAV
jgi:hypothetical protein